MTLFATPFLPHPAKVNYLLDKLCIHRPWFDDLLWTDPKVRREAASRRMAEWLVNGVIWEAWGGAELVGVLGVDRLTQREAYCHFVFFDRKLADKEDLCRSLMAWCFERLGLHILRIEIPTYARALAAFARKRLDFKYEAEDRDLSWPHGPHLGAREAERGSRKYHGTLYEGDWHDLLCLSLTREEFIACQDHPSPAAPSTPLPSANSVTPHETSSAAS